MEVVMSRRESVPVQSLSLYSETSSGGLGRINFAPQLGATVATLTRFDAEKYIREIIERLQSNPQIAVETGIVLRRSNHSIKHEVVEHYDQAYAIVVNKDKILAKCPNAFIVIGVEDID